MQNPDAPWLIAGLGNPGSRYAGTRHNTGFMVVDELARRHGLKLAGKQANSEIARGSIAGKAVIIAKPHTYMNNSGRAVSALAHYYRVPLDHLFVVYDDIALPLGTMRIRGKGSAGGHNGVESVIRQLGTQNFPRLRVGVDRPVEAGHSQISWVLNRFSKDELRIMEEMIPLAADAIEAVLREGLDRAMNTYNTMGGTQNSDDRPQATDDRGASASSVDELANYRPSSSSEERRG